MVRIVEVEVESEDIVGDVVSKQWQAIMDLPMKLTECSEVVC